MRRILFALFLLLTIILIQAHAEDTGWIKGSILSVTGTPLDHVQVQLVGTTFGAVSNQAGEFRMS